ncbi:AAA family ATPase, partial [Roseovarius tibetensis]|uniref:AAA family ATPase n=1 Tax=Roseovarius tibetensis TaxID=2685897 RepID=UPI003D7FC582
LTPIPVCHPDHTVAPGSGQFLEVPMYLYYFGLREFPFRITPDPSFLFWTADHHRAFDLLNRVAHGEKPVAIILGEPGTGKTTLLRHFTTSLPKDIQIGMISNYSSGMGGLDHWLHSAFDLRPAGPEEKFGASFEAHLVARHNDGGYCLLIVDEAQNVSDEDIGALTDLTRLSAQPGASLRLVIAGQPQLGRRFRTTHDPGTVDDLAPLRIGPMSPEDVIGYVYHRMTVSGCQTTVFDDAALKRIAQTAAGVPRVVNLLCELMLMSAFNADERKIDLAFVDRALHDARQNGMLDHLHISPDQPASAVAPMPVGAITRTPPVNLAPATVGPRRPLAKAADLATLRSAPATAPALPEPPHVIGSAPIPADKSRTRRIALAFLAVSVIIAGLALTVLPSHLNRPTATNVAAPVDIGPALPTPAHLHGTDATTLQKQALAIGEQDPLTAAIGFARAALRGDTRAAYYLGQHFEVGDGVPRNIELAAAWYALASETQRSARRALQNLPETTNATGDTPAHAPRPLMGIVGVDRVAEFVWEAPGDAANRYLIELAHAPDAEPRQYGPFDLSAARLDAPPTARLWRVVSLGPDDARIGASDWHLINTAKAKTAVDAPNQ